MAAFVAVRAGKEPKPVIKPSGRTRTIKDMLEQHSTIPRA